MKRSFLRVAAGAAITAALLLFVVAGCVPYSGNYYDGYYGTPGAGYYGYPYGYHDYYDNYYNGGPGGLILDFGFGHGFDRDDFGHGHRGFDRDHDHDRD